MLPGLRFLFAAVVLAVSFLVFGLGATALLRGAHEEFASLPARRSLAPATFAPQLVEAPPTLAMLRLEPRVDDAPAVAPTATPEPAPVIASVIVDPAPPAAPEAVEAAPAALSVPVAVASDPAPAPDPAPAAETAPADTPKTVVAEPAAPVAAETVAPTVVAELPAEPVVAVPAPEPDVATTASTDDTPATLTKADAQLTSSKVATLGDKPAGARATARAKKPAVVAKKAKKRVVVKKRKRAPERRPMAPPAVQPQLDLFGQPFTPVR